MILRAPQPVLICPRWISAVEVEGHCHLAPQQRDLFERHVQHSALVIPFLRTLNAFVASSWLQVALVLATLLVAGMAADSGTCWC